MVRMTLWSYTTLTDVAHLRRSSLVNGGRLQPLQRLARVVVAARAH
jgi:hypothetical protein